MKFRNITIFLLMQVFFVVLGFALFFGLSTLKASQKEKEEGMPRQSINKEEDVDIGQDYCDFAAWSGKPVDEKALIAIGRPYRVLPPGSMYSMDYNAARINVYTDHEALVIKVGCG